MYRKKTVAIIHHIFTAIKIEIKQNNRKTYNYLNKSMVINKKGESVN